MEEYKVLLEHGDCQLFLSNNSSYIKCHVIFLKNRIIQIKNNLAGHCSSKSRRRKTANTLNQSLIIELSLNYLVSYHFYIQKLSQNENQNQKEFLQIKIKNKINQQKIKLVFLLCKTDALHNFVEDYFTSYVWLRNFNIKYQIQKQISIQQKERISNIYLVKQKLTKKKYWVKCYSKDSFFNDKDKNLQKIILNQIENQSKVPAKHKIAFNKFYQDNYKFYLVYEKIPQKTLKQFLIQMRSQEIELIKIKIIIRSLLKIIIDLKKEQIVLRNLKTANIGFLNLEESFKPCILDFSHSSSLSSGSSINTTKLFSLDYGVRAPQFFQKTKKQYKFLIKAMCSALESFCSQCYSKSIPYTQEDKILRINLLNLIRLQISKKYLPTQQRLNAQIFFLRSLTMILQRGLNLKQLWIINFQILKKQSTYRVNKRLTQDFIKQQTQSYQRIDQEWTEPSLKQKKRFSSLSSSSSYSPSKFMVQSKKKKAKVIKDKSDGNLDSSDLDDQHPICIPISSQMKPSWQNKKKSFFLNNTT